MMSLANRTPRPTTPTKRRSCTTLPQGTECTLFGFGSGACDRSHRADLSTEDTPTHRYASMVATSDSCSASSRWTIAGWPRSRHIRERRKGQDRPTKPAPSRRPSDAERMAPGQ
jgi:hypothetical protein